MYVAYAVLEKATTWTQSDTDERDHHDIVYTQRSPALLTIVCIICA